MFGLSRLKLKPPRPDDWKAWASAARDWAAVLYTPVVTSLLGWIIWILAFVDWTQASERQRIGYLGNIGLALVGLVAVGVLWFQRRDIDGLNLKTRLGELNINTRAGAPDPVNEAATVAAVEALAPAKVVSPPDVATGEGNAGEPRL